MRERLSPWTLLLAGAAAAPATGSPLALLTGGKSAGHVFPALAVGDALRERGWRLAYAGLADSMEERLAGSRGIEFHRIAARPLVGRGILERIRALLTALREGLAARSLVRRLGACVIVATGGFVSVPAVLGGWLARRAVVLLEPNAEPGAANRLLSRFADFAALGHAAAATGLRCRSAVTGVPVRREFAGVADLRVTDLERSTGGPVRLLVLGGSQGAARLNAVLPRALAALRRGVLRVEVLHQTGAANLAATADAYRELFSEQGESCFERAGVSIELTPFVDDVTAAVASCHLVISRSGAITLAELCAAGRGALLVPLRLAGGHQLANARALAEAGAAVVVEDAGSEFGERLADELWALLESPDRLVEMGRSARTLGAPRAAAEIADHIERLAGRVAA
ncbi:MAG TPA: UDP-N-acetylglucosamine--N-acetylmuramyl-(pentapeptide) pyrophosphoryl-undecaprenol N-acetylglucosamine transferase [Thermoanaerobaculia bacterium]|nr:UDP-N-acetylglucosamine--N-acetylmuramyl-(pentapeptide) pyrophosphoryl-undecaprenol N-acetylglucosamine transferase [Thermoanaerobaculia bacterium]